MPKFRIFTRSKTQSELESNAEERIAILFSSIQTNSRNLQAIEDIMLNTRAQLEAVLSPGNSKSRLKKNIKRLLGDSIDEIGQLAVPKDRKEQKDLTKALEKTKKTLGKLIDKDTSFNQQETSQESGLGNTYEVLDNNISTQLPRKKMRLARTQERWQRVQNELPNIAKLADTKRSIAVTESYYSEVLFNPHLPSTVGGGGGGMSLISAIQSTYHEGRIPEHYKNLYDENGNTLYDRLETLANESVDKVDFVNRAYDLFRRSPDITDDWKQKLTVVQYLNEADQHNNQLVIRDGLLYLGDELFDTSNMRGKNSQGKAAYVITEDGNILAAEHQGGIFHHSSFTSASRVKSAGMIEVVNGKIIQMDNESGHYQPQEHNVYEAFAVMERNDNSLESAFADHGRLVIKHSIRQEEPETYGDFMNRAAEPAEQRWNQIQQEQESYRRRFIASTDASITEELLTGVDEAIVNLQNITRETPMRVPNNTKRNSCSRDR